MPRRVVDDLKKTKRKPAKFPADNNPPLKFGRFESRTSEQNKRSNRVTVIISKVNSSYKPFCFGDGLICSHDDKPTKKRRLQN